MQDFKNGEFNAEEFADRIHYLREEQHLTKVELATRAGYDASYITRIEKGSQTPRIEAISVLAIALGVTTEYLMFGEPDPSGVLDGLRFCIRKLTEIENRLSNRE
ncbi:MAG: helix-turn-helix domain-containing protein [Oscillospiraceae bacterium]|nr:helix-turn-helix domain-containing protein [Oscillospiraceae bacterium]